MGASDWVGEGETAPPAGGQTWGQYAYETADDALRAAGNAMTFGMQPRMVGGMESLLTGKGYNDALAAEVKKGEVARERSPYASVAGDVAGSLAIPGFGAEALAARLGGRALARAGAYGLTGAATGAAAGAGNTYSGEVPDYVKNALIGGGLGAALGGIGGAAFGRGPAQSAAAVPTQAELWAAKNTGYGALGNSGARYEASALHDLANTTEQNLLADRYHWRDSPGTWRGIEEARGGGAPGQLNTGPNAIIDPGNIDFIVKGLNRIPQTEATQTDRASASVLKRALNDFVENPPAGAVLPGTEREAAQAATLARNARGDYGAYKRVQNIDELASNAANTTGANFSGLNLQNELRKGVRTFIKEKGGESPASRAYFNDPEIAALRDYTRGTNATNLTRYVSNALGGGGGLGTLAAGAAGYGAAAGGAGFAKGQDPETASVMGLVGAVGAPIAGLLTRRYGNQMADRQLQQLRDMIARRSPLYDYRASMSGTVPGAGSPRTAKNIRDALTLEVMKQAGPQRVNIDTTDWK
jgi:hypothetical protein